MEARHAAQPIAPKETKMSLNIALLTTYATQLNAIVVAAGTKAVTLDEAAKAHNTAVKSSVASAIRTFAKDTAAAGVDASEANSILSLTLTAAGVKSGTVKGYGSSFRGYRQLLAEGKPVDEVNTAEAQMVVASAEVKAAKAAKDRIAAAIKGWDAALLSQLAELAEAMAPTKADNKPGEVIVTQGDEAAAPLGEAVAA